MKYCIECGYECSDDAKFCGLCGYAFEVVPEIPVDVAEPEVESSDKEAEAVVDVQMTAEATIADKLTNTVEATKELDENYENNQENYKEQMLQYKQTVDELTKQQRQLQHQLQTMQKQQWNQAEQQQKQQKLINHYRYQASQQQMMAQTQRRGAYVRNIWSLIAAIICMISFFINDFVKVEMIYYETSYGLMDFCGKGLDFVGYSKESLATWIISMLPLLVIVLVIVLIVGGYRAVHGIRGWIVVANIIAIITTFFYVKVEGYKDSTFGISFWILAVGIGLATYSCWTDEPEKYSQTGTLGYDVDGPTYNLSLLAADTSLELKQEWRCPKCDSKNPIDYKYCKTCSTSRD